MLAVSLAVVSVAVVAAEVVPLVAQFQKDETGQVDPGWSGVQLGIGVSHLVLGTIALAEESSRRHDSGIAVGLGALGFGILWSGLGAYNLLAYERNESETRSALPTAWVSPSGAPFFGLTGRF